MNGRPMIMFDTNILVFLSRKNLKIFNKSTLEIIENSDCFISPMVILELQYLNEVGRFTATPEFLIDTMSAEIGLKIDEVDFQKVVEEGVSIDWTRDPFDRLIVANAKFRKCKLVTKDQRILDNFELAVW